MLLDFNMLCLTVAMQTQGIWAKLETAEDGAVELEFGGVFRIWEGELLVCVSPKLLRLICGSELRERKEELVGAREWDSASRSQKVAPEEYQAPAVSQRLDSAFAPNHSHSTPTCPEEVSMRHGLILPQSLIQNSTMSFIVFAMMNFPQRVKMVKEMRLLS